METLAEFFDEEEVKKFKSIFHEIIKDIWADDSMGTEIPESLTRLQKNLEYNVPYYTKYRGFLIPYIYKQAVKTKPTETQYHLVQLIGWVVQIETFMVGKHVICMNDTILVEQVAFRLLQKYLGDQPILFTKISCCLNNLMYQYYLGESLETLKNFDKFTMERYMSFQKYTVVNGPYCSLFFEIPLWFADNQDEALVEEIKDICSDLGYLWTITDDLDDSYADKSENSGAHDNDIMRGKITWLIVTAKERCSKEQLETLKNNYGKGNEKSVEIVKQIYEDLGVPELCRKHIKDKYEELIGKVRKMEERGEPLAKPLKVMVLFYVNMKE